MYTKESLERLKQKIDLVELLSSYIELKKSGAHYKALCPFHDERSPSFVVAPQDTHYHCFGCGAHGDAIGFLMNHLNLSFQEAVQQLAERFQVPLEFIDRSCANNGQDLAFLKEALDHANQFFHYMLLHSSEAQSARSYLYERGLHLNFIKQFSIGFAPKNSLFRRLMSELGYKEEILVKAGLVHANGHDFFQERVTFPICNPFGQVIGFSARKIVESTFGGKYINTSETPLFKKSSILFGLNYCRRRIAKQECAIIVEGQIDCLRLIEAGLGLTVAALGTAFGKSHAEQLQKIGVKRVYLLFDGDAAGKSAASKVGDLFQQLGIDVLVARLPEKEDPDSLLRKEGIARVVQALQESQEYLAFQLNYLGAKEELLSPAAKSSLVHQIREQIEGWNDPLMIHESLKKLAQLADLPSQILPQVEKKRAAFQARLGNDSPTSDFNHVLEMDLLRWLILKGGQIPSFIKTVQKYLSKDHFWNPMAQRIYISYLEQIQEGSKNHFDFLTLMIESQEAISIDFIDEIMKRRINTQKATPLFLESVQKLVDRKWLSDGEVIRRQIESNAASSDGLELVKAFDLHKKSRILVELQNESA